MHELLRVLIWPHMDRAHCSREPAPSGDGVYCTAPPDSIMRLWCIRRNSLADSSMHGQHIAFLVWLPGRLIPRRRGADLRHATFDKFSSPNLVNWISRNILQQAEYPCLARLKKNRDSQDLGYRLVCSCILYSRSSAVYSPPIIPKGCSVTFTAINCPDSG